MRQLDMNAGDHHDAPNGIYSHKILFLMTLTQSFINTIYRTD